MLNDKKYWIERHKDIDDLKAPGLQSVSHSANQYIYKMVLSQYEQLLSELDLTSVRNIFDAGYGDGTFLSFFNEKYPDIELYGADISPYAKKKINIRALNKQNLEVGNLSDPSIYKEIYDITYCFDVLYHILDDSEFEIALQNLCDKTNMYLILHDRFIKRPQIISKPHVRMRINSEYERILSKNGFEQCNEIPTHFFAMRPLTYSLNRYFAKQFYNVDRYIARNFTRENRKKLGTHFIRVYSRGAK